MPQYEGLAIPFSGDSDAKTSGNAQWLQTLRRAALGRNNQTLPQDQQKTGLVLSWGVQDLPQGSVIGAIGAMYPGSPTSEPVPYMKGHLGRSQLTLYTLQSFATANAYIECFAFSDYEPVRVRVDYDAGDYYRTGMPVGRLAGSTKVRAGGGGLILLTLPYTPDGGANYYSWVIKDVDNSWEAKLTEDLYAAVNSKRDPSIAKAVLYRLKTDGDLAGTLLEVDVVNRLKNISVDANSYIKIEWQKGEWQPYVADCPGGSSSSGSV